MVCVAVAQIQERGLAEGAVGQDAAAQGVGLGGLLDLGGVLDLAELLDQVGGGVRGLEAVPVGVQALRAQLLGLLQAGVEDLLFLGDFLGGGGRAWCRWVARSWGSWLGSRRGPYRIVGGS
jgi:hypothetical protein